MTPATLADRPEALALFLDVDGTLLPIEDHPAHVVGDSALTELLAQLSRQLSGALALVSGRPIAELDRLFEPLTLPAAGAHGSEFRGVESERGTERSEAVPTALLEEVQTYVDDNPGLLLERKSLGFALHYRRRPELEGECMALAEAVARRAGPDFRRISGKMVIELSPAAHDKGRAIERFLAQPPFAGRTPVFVGDDVTDEAGFAVVNRLGGCSIRVGPHDDSAATASLADVAAVRDWLGILADSSQRVGT